MAYVPNMINPMGINNNNNMGMMNIPQMNMGTYQPNVGAYQRPQQQQNANQNTNMNFLVVQSMQEAKEKVIPYGCTVWMRDSSEPYQYVKSIDVTGSPTFKVLKVEDVTEQMLNDNGQFKETEKFVPIQDFNALNSKVDQLQNTVNYCSGVLNQVLTPQAQQNNTVIDVEPKEVKKIGRPTKTEKVGEANG